MTDVLRRKVGARRAPKAATGPTLEAVLRKIMPRDADAVLSLDLKVGAFAVSTMDIADLRDEIRAFDLVYLLETPDGARGLAVLDAGLASAIIEVLVSGSVSQKAPSERKPTRTDGIVAGEIVDRWLESAGTAMAEVGLESAWPFADFERAPVAIGRREAELLLEPVEFKVFDVTLAFSLGERTGLLRLVAPRTAPLLEQQENTTAARVRGHLPGLPVDLRAVLARLPVGMSEVSGLRSDTVLRLPDGCLRRVRLETRAGKLIQEVRLGELDGQKAVRLADDRPEEKPVPLGVTGLPNLPPVLPDVEGEAKVALPDPSSLPEPLEGGPAPLDAGPPNETSVRSAPSLPDLLDLPDLPELPELP